MAAPTAAGLPEPRPVLARQRHPLVFATVSGAHLYGSPSRDSGADLRGFHLLPVEDLTGPREGEETAGRMRDRDGAEPDLVTHGLRGFARLTLRRYRGFAGTRWRLCGRTGEPKPLLHTFRAPLTGIRPMRTGEVCARLPTLAEEVGEAPATSPG